MNQIIRKVVGLLLLASIFSGCGNVQENRTGEAVIEQTTEEKIETTEMIQTSQESDEKTSAPQGRYVENVISLPDVFGIGQGQENPIYIPILKKSDGNIMLFTGKGKLDVSNSLNCLFRLNPDHSFTEITPEWMKKEVKNEYIIDVEPMENGDWYFLSAKKLVGTTESFQYFVKKYDINSNSIEIVLNEIAMVPRYLSVGKNLTVVVSNNDAAVVYEYNQTEYTAIISGLDVDYGGVFVDESGTIIAKEKSENGPWGYRSYDGVTGENIAPITMEGMFKLSWQRSSFFQKENSTYYMCNPNGIYSKNEKSENWKLQVEGRAGKWLGSANIEIFDLKTGYNDDFYALIRNQSTTSDQMSPIVLCQYYYDQEEEPLPTRFFSIVSMWENEYINKAIEAFQLSHPELTIEYRILSSMVNVDQAIESLAEQLRKNEAPDVVILDGLPKQFYNNDDYFMDLTNAIMPQIKGVKKGEYYYSVLSSIQSEKGLYAVVTRFSPIFVTAQSDIISRVGSLEQLADEARNNRDENIVVPEFYIDQKNRKHVFLNYIYSHYGKELYDDNGEISQQSLTKWIENLEILYSQVFQTDQMDEDAYLFGWEREVLEMISNKRGKMVMLPYNEAMPPTAAQGLHFEGYESKYSGNYIQGTIASIPNRATNVEEASEFVRYLLSAGFQNYVPFGEWLPVYRESVKLDTLRYLKEWEKWGEYHYIPEYGKEYPVYTMSQKQIDWFRWELEGFELTEPARPIIDYNRHQTIPDENLQKLQRILPQYLQGNITIEEAVNEFTNTSLNR